MFKKRTKGLSRNTVKGRKNPTRKKVHSKARKIVKRENNYSFSSSIFSSFIIFGDGITSDVLSLVLKNAGKQFYVLGDDKVDQSAESPRSLALSPSSMNLLEFFGINFPVEKLNKINFYTKSYIKIMLLNYKLRNILHWILWIFQNRKKPTHFLES